MYPFERVNIPPRSALYQASASWCIHGSKRCRRLWLIIAALIKPLPHQRKRRAQRPWARLAVLPKRKRKFTCDTCRIPASRPTSSARRSSWFRRSRPVATRETRPSTKRQSRRKLSRDCSFGPESNECLQNECRNNSGRERSMAIPFKWRNVRFIAVLHHLYGIHICLSSNFLARECIAFNTLWKNTEEAVQ